MAEHGIQPWVVDMKDHIQDRAGVYVWFYLIYSAIFVVADLVKDIKRGQL